MEQTFYQVTIRHEKTLEDGKTKMVNENYMTRADNFTMAEGCATTFAMSYWSGFDITAIKRTKIEDYIVSSLDDAKPYLLTIGSVGYDDNDKAKMTKYQYIVCAVDIDTAKQQYENKLKSDIADEVLLGIKETNIIDLI